VTRGLLPTLYKASYNPLFRELYIRIIINGDDETQIQEGATFRFPVAGLPLPFSGLNVSERRSSLRLNAARMNALPRRRSIYGTTTIQHLRNFWVGRSAFRSDRMRIAQASLSYPSCVIARRDGFRVQRFLEAGRRCQQREP
jgi:hypothetical protein